MSTTGARVRCPHCGKGFKIPDRALLGRVGKCSACAQRFTLTEDDGTEARASAEEPRSKPEPAEPKPPRPEPAAAKPPRPATTESKPSVPAAKPAAAAAPAAAPAAVTPVRKAAPVAETKTPARPIKPVETAVKAPAAAVEIPWGLNAQWVPDDDQGEGAFSADTGFPFGTSDEPAPAVTAASVKSRGETAARKGSVARPGRAGSSGKKKLLIGGTVAAVLVGGGLAALKFMPAGGTPQTVTAPVVTNTPVTTSPGVYSRDMLKGNVALMDEFRPTKGQPVSLQYVPNGVNLVVHLHPAALWGNEHAMAELRGSLTEGVTQWLEQQIKASCKREPARIGEVTFAFTLGALGTVPTHAEVVRLAEPTQTSALLDEFRGQALNDNLKPTIMVADGLSRIVVDGSTYVLAPAEAAEEMVDALKGPNTYVSRNVADLIKETDRDRLITIVAEIPDLRRHVDSLFPEDVRPVIHDVLDFLGDDVDAIAWSLHTVPALHSEIVLRPRSGVSARSLEQALQKRLDELPARVADVVKGTRPSRKGFRELIGRYPAMLEAFRQATVMRPGNRELTATTVLPGKAAPNLALGTVLAWDEVRRTGGSNVASTTTAPSSTPMQSVADRLKKPILAEFNRMPLEQAIQYVGGETGVNFVVDGEALRLSGYTRNMPQSMSLGTVPATEVLKSILSVENQSELAVFVDEPGNKAVLSTKAALMQQGKTEFPIR